jgi:hypothetical protein
MTDPFETSRRKIASAKEKVADLERHFKAFWRSNPWYRLVEPDPDDPQLEIHRFKLKAPFPPSFAEITADVFHSLRSSLDDAVCALCIAAGKPSGSFPRRK